MVFDILDLGFPKSGTDWKSINGKPYITVSSKGRSNGLSNKINDGADFGPDTTLNASSPNQTGAPYSPYIGIEEAIKYAIANNIGEIRLSTGLFNITNAPFTTDPVTGRKYKLYIPIVNQSITGGDNNPISLKIVGGGKVVPTGYWSNIATPGYLNTTVIYDGTVDTTTTNTANDFMFGVMATPSTSSENPYNFIMLYTDGVLFQTQGTTNSYLGGVDVLNAIQASFGKIRIEMLQGQGLAHQSATGMMWVYGGGMLPVNTAESIDLIGWQDGLISSFGHMYIGYIHVSRCYYAMSSYFPIVNYANQYPAFISVAEFEICSYGLNLNTGPLSSESISTLITFGSFGFGDSFLTGSPVNYIASIISSGNSFGNAITILKYELGPSGIVPIFSLGASWDKIEILSWGNINGQSSGWSPIPTTPTVPASGTAQVNSNPYAVNVYLSGGTVTEIQITLNGTAYTVFSNSTGLALSGQVYKLRPSDSITITYTTAPTWIWMCD